MKQLFDILTLCYFLKILLILRLQQDFFLEFYLF